MEINPKCCNSPKLSVFSPKIISSINFSYQFVISYRLFSSSYHLFDSRSLVHIKTSSVHAHKHKSTIYMDPQHQKPPEAAMASHDNGNVTEYETRPRKSILKQRDGNTMPLVPLNDTNGQEPARIVNRRVSFAEKVKLHQIDLVHVPHQEWSGSELASMDESDEDISFLKLEADADEIVNKLLGVESEVPQLSSDEDGDLEEDEDIEDDEQTMELTGQIKEVQKEQLDHGESIEKGNRDIHELEKQNREPQELEKRNREHEPDEQKELGEPEYAAHETDRPADVDGEMDEADMEFTEPLNVPVVQEQVNGHFQTDSQDQEDTMDITKLQYTQPEAAPEATVELTMDITKQYDIPQLSSALGSEDDKQDEQPPPPKSSSPFQIPHLEPLTDNSDDWNEDVPMELTQPLSTTEQGSRLRDSKQAPRTESDRGPQGPEQGIAQGAEEVAEQFTNNGHEQDQDIQNEHHDEEQEMELTGTIRMGLETEKGAKNEQANEEDQKDGGCADNLEVQNTNANLNGIGTAAEAPNPPKDQNINTPVSNVFPNGKRSRLNEALLTPTRFHTETATTSTIPLADVSMSSNGDADIEIPVVSLTEFLTEIGIKFYDDLEFSIDMSNRYRLSLSDTHGLLSEDDYYRANIQLPVLEVFELCCKELSEKIKQGKKLFDELKGETLQNNPDIFRKYFKASFYDQMTMKSRFHTLKEYTRQQAKQIWYRWRTKLIENILDVLKGNLELLESDKATLIDQISSLDALFRDIQQLYHSIRLDILQFKDIQTRFENLDTEQLKNIKSKLTDLNQQLIDHKAKITQKEKELTTLQDEIDEKNNQISTLKRQLAASDNKLSQMRPFNSAEIGDLEFKSLMLQAGAGLEYVKVVQEKTFEFQFNPRVKVIIDFSEPNSPKSITLLLLNHSKDEVLHNDYLLMNYCQKIAEQTGFTNIYDSFVSFRRKWLKITEIDLDIYQISVKYPVKFNASSDHIDFTFRYYSFEQKQKAECNVTIPLDTILDYPKNVKVRVILYRPSQKDEFDIKRQITLGSTKYLMFRNLQEVEN